LISSDNILGASNAQGQQGGSGAAKSGSSSGHHSSGTKSSTVVVKSDNSQHNGQGSGLIGVGVDALNK
jgi:hypothetical protein